MKFTEEELKKYAAPLSDWEDQQCLHAISMISDALKKLGFSDSGNGIRKMYSDTYAYSAELRGNNRKIKLFVQGSYANNTNVRGYSDVDVAVIQEEVFKTHYRKSTLYPQSDETYHFVVVPRKDKSFKDEVEECLRFKFGPDVERKNKSIKIHGNTYRKDADSVPCMRYRDYSENYSNNENNYVGGVVITSDEGETIINYPEQHIKNGREKNVSTNHWYKKMVRIFKKIRYLMVEFNIEAADHVSSFGIESMLWNIPDDIYKKWYSYGFKVEELINYLVQNVNNISNHYEANGIKKLCPSQKETTAYVEFVNALENFFSYNYQGGTL